MKSFIKNRYSFSETYEHFFDYCNKLSTKKSENRCCLAIDIEHFKLFNEIYGQEMGDTLLTAFFSIFKKMEEELECVAGYFGQDDFALFGEFDPDQIESLYLQLKNAVADRGITVGFLPAIGIYRLAEEDPVDLKMYDKALSALIDAKKHRSKRICEYDDTAFQNEMKERQILVDLKKAIDNGQITFYLQPQCRISTKKIVGAEALARWIKPDGSMIPPGVFIPPLERSGIIAEFDRLIWEMVCKWLRSLLDRGITPIPISINISQMDILTMDVVAVLSTLCEQYQIPVHLLKIEITESSYAEAFDRVNALVKELRSKGFITMMDDFGSGYSSLNMLENITVDVLKLDMIFVKEKNLHSRRGITIVESIINMAKMMHLPIVVEGIEAQEQVDFLKNLGCQYAQGYYYYRPTSIESFEKLMLDERNLDYRGFQCKQNEQIHVREFLDENTFTDTMLNNILGAVAFYSLENRDLTITRFNEQFYHAIGDPSMETRQRAIQNYVVKEDWPSLYRALDDACTHVANGGICEIRFYKSDGSVFWFRMHFFFLRHEQEKKIFYGQVEDVTEARTQSIQFFEVLCEQADVTMMINLNRKSIQYVTGIHTMQQIGLPSIDLESSIERTMDVRIDDESDKKRFKAFFDPERLRSAHQKAIYHESITVNFRMSAIPEPVEFSTYYIRYNKDQDLNVYAFAKRLGTA